MPNLNTSYSFPGSNRQTVIDHYGNAIVTTVVVGNAKSGSVDRFSVNTPGFGKFRKLHPKMRTDLPMNPFSYLKRDMSVGHGFYSITSVSGNYNISNSGADPGVAGGTLLMPDTVLLNNARARVDAKLLEKLKDSSVNLSQVFAERRLTADLIASTAKRLAAAMIALKRGQFRNAAKALGATTSRRMTSRFNRLNAQNPRQAVANGWLELQYGWKPLLQDIYGSAEWLANKQSREIRRYVSSKHHADLVDFTITPLGGNYRSDFHLTRDTSFDFKGIVYFSTSGSQLASAKEAGLTNPALLAWELMPWSFVVDWFIPVGTFLSNLDSTLGLSFEKGSYTTFWRAHATNNLLAFNRQGGSVHGSSDEVHNCIVKGSNREIYVRRDKMLDFPANALPSFKNPFSFTHAANAIALLSQVFSKR